MPLKRPTAYLLLALTLALALTGCVPDTGGKVEITDAVGGTVTLAKPAQKIIAMVPSDVEILYELGAGGQIAAVGEYCDWPAEALDKPSVGTGENTSVEQLIALQPDLVIIGVMAQDAAHSEALTSAGIPVMVTDSQTIEDTYITIGKIGTLAGKSAEADKLVEFMKNKFAEITANAENSPLAERKSAYVEVSPLEFGLFTCGKGTFIDELMTIAGVNNAFGDMEGWPMISEEQVIGRNPDVILTTSDGSFGPPDPVAEINARAGWDTITAVASGAVKMIDSDMCTRPGPRLMDAAQAVYDAVYGQ